MPDELPPPAHGLSGPGGEEGVIRLLDSITEGFCAFDAEWRAIYFNEAARRILAPHVGDLKTLLGQLLWDAFPGTRGARMEHEYRRAVADGVTVEFEDFYAPWQRWFRLRASPMRGGGLSVSFRDITEERQAADALRASERRYRSLFESLDEGFCVLQMVDDEEGRAIDYLFLELNQAFENQTGLQNAIGRRALEMVPELEAYWIRTYDEVTRTREPRRFTQGSRAMGRWYDVYAFPHGEPKARQVAVLFTDITQRRRAEERQRFLVELDDAVRPLSEAGEITAAAARLLGQHIEADRCAYADVEGDEDTFNLTGDFCRGVPSIVGRYTFTQFGAEVLRRMRANEPYVVEDIESHWPHPGDLSAYQATQIRAVVCVPLHKSGRFVAAMAVHQKTPRRWTPDEIDLTLTVANRCWEALERTRVSRVLAESEARFRTLADHIAQLAWMADAQGAVSWYNQRWFDFTGTTLEQVQGWGWRTVFHPEYVEAVAEKWERHLALGLPWEDTFPLRRHDGIYRWFLSRAVPICDSHGQVLRWFGTNTDITEQREAAEALARAKEQAEAGSRAKDEFLAALSHELRTPLTPVLMATHELCEDASLPSATRHTLAMMRRNIELEARLINDLLDLTRIASGKLAVRKQACDLHSAVANAVDIVAEEARQKGVILELKLAAPRTHVQGEAARLQQVLWNLLKNAVKFTPTGGRVTVESWNQGTQIALAVRDTGAGIAPELLERIFEPFEQGGRANDHRFGGLGLGLSIARAITNLHGGTIVAESAGLGAGALFKLLLETCEAGPELTSKVGEPGAPIPQATARKMNLLLVEDHEATREILARLLRRDGHEVVSAGTVAEARALAAEQQFDGVISDIGLPDATGVALMESLHRSYGLRGVALSGYGMEEDLRRSEQAGFVAHLVKPVDFALLRQALAAFSETLPALPSENR